MRLKKRIFACAILALTLSLFMQNTLAYFSAAETARNVITSGGIDITLVEQQEVDGTLQPYPAEAVQIMPGDAVSKVVTVTNHEMPAYVRVRCAITVLDANADPLTDAQAGNAVKVDMDTKNWTFVDGWWYYNTALETGGTTAPLFTQVIFDVGMGNEYKNCTAIIDVQAQATQVVNNGTDVFTAAGWPAA